VNALLTAIVTWLSINFGLPAIYDHPTIELSPAARIAEIRYGVGNSIGSREVVAIYDDAKKEILLPDTWTGKIPADLSILVHEMVHHLQNVGGLKYECPASREKLAYAAQNAWLGLFGQNLSAEFKLDPMTLKLATRCMHY
jgi:hypothetical protein